jgi:hypothetical protein
MQTLTDIPSCSSGRPDPSNRSPRRRGQKKPRSKSKLHGRVSEVTVLGRSLAILAPIAAIVGLALGLPAIFGAAGLLASLFGVAICFMERRAVTKY